VLAKFEQEDRGSNAIISSRSECCSPSLAWTHSLTHRRCRPIFLLDVQKLQRCVPNVGDLMPRDRGSGLALDELAPESAAGDSARTSAEKGDASSSPCSRPQSSSTSRLTAGAARPSAGSRREIFCDAS